MEKFKDIKKLNEIYLTKLETYIKENLNLIKESFTKYYGSNYSEFINKTLDKVNYVYMLSNNFFSFYKKYNPQDSKLYTYYEKYIKRLYGILKTLPDFLKDDFLYDNFVISSTLDRDTLDDLYFIEAINDGGCFHIASVNNDQEIKLVALTIVTINTHIILHELSHALSTHVYAYDYGMCYTNDPFFATIVEELINELITTEVEQIFAKSGGKIISGISENNYVNGYMPGLYLVIDFYHNFKDLIKEVLITQNDKLLYYSLGKEVLEEYCLLVDKVFFKVISFNKVSSRLKELLNIMEDNYLNFNLPDYNSYINNLVSKSLVRKLN